MTLIRTALPPAAYAPLPGADGAAASGLAGARQIGASGGAGWGRPQIAAGASAGDQLAAAAQEFEGLFLAQFLKEARDGGLGEGLFDNAHSDTFQSMLDTELARGATAGAMDLGIARALVAQLGPQVRTSGAQD